MNRDRKYRAYVKSEGCMADVQLIDFKDKYIITEQDFTQDEEGCDPRVQFNFDDISICEFTGLKDKNGACIYLGDIVHIFHWQEEPKYGRHIQGVVFQHESGVYQLDDKNSTRMWSYLEEEREVIGNVYENPELLTQESNDRR